MNPVKTKIKRIRAYQLREWKANVLKTLALLLLVLLPSLAFAQGGSVASGGIVVFGPTGRPLAGATVTICTSAGAGIPCSPAASVFSDVGLTLPVSNTQTSDGLGNVLVFASPGVYKYSVSGNGITPTLLTATVSGSGGGNAVTGGPNAFTGNNTHSGVETFNTNAIVANAGITSAGPNALAGGGSVTGTYSGSPTLTGVWTWNTFQAAFLAGLLTGPFTSTNIGGELNFVEVAPFTPAAGGETCYGDSAQHALLCGYNGNTMFRMTQTVASGTAVMPVALIGAGACSATVTVAATNVVSTDTINTANNAAVAANPGVLIINKWPTAGNVNFNYCNGTAAGVTPAAATINWNVVR